MGMVTISFETGGRKGFEPINDSRPSLCATPALEVFFPHTLFSEGGDAGGAGNVVFFFGVLV